MQAGSSIEFEKKYGFKCPLGVKGRNSDNKLYEEKIGWSVSQPLMLGLIKTYEWIDNQVKLLEKNISKINWVYLCKNPNAIHILEKNPDKIDWDCLCSNPNAIPILEKNIDKIDFNVLLFNENAVDILDQNLDKLFHRDLHMNNNPKIMNTIHKCYINKYIIISLYIFLLINISIVFCIFFSLYSIYHRLCCSSFGKTPL